MDLAFNSEAGSRTWPSRKATGSKPAKMIAELDPATYEDALRLATGPAGCRPGAARQAAARHPPGGYRPGRANAAAAKAALANAEATFYRQQTLVQTHATPQQAVDDARRALDTARAPDRADRCRAVRGRHRSAHRGYRRRGAQLRQAEAAAGLARTQLGRTKLSAPSDGVGDDARGRARHRGHADLGHLLRRHHNRGVGPRFRPGNDAVPRRAGTEVRVATDGQPGQGLSRPCRLRVPPGRVHAQRRSRHPSCAPSSSTASASAWRTRMTGCAGPAGIDQPARVARRMSAPLVQIEGLTHTFGPVTALADISAMVMPGMITGLVGPDAAGKTTLLRVLAGLLRPQAGRVTVFRPRHDAERCRGPSGHRLHAAALRPVRRPDRGGEPRPVRRSARAHGRFARGTHRPAAAVHRARPLRRASRRAALGRDEAEARPRLRAPGAPAPAAAR